jgi:type II secretory pathway component PulK
MFVASDGGDMEEEDIQELATTGSVSEEIRTESLEEGSRFGGRNFLDFDGDFMAEVKGEDCGINVNALSTRSTDERPEDTAAGKQILGLMTGEEHDQWLRERSLDKYDLVGNLADWVDADNIVASGKGGYEDDFYNTLASPYLAKNARFDSREEIRLVEGWQDDVFDRWGEQLTIYGSGKVNVSCADDVVLGGLIKAHLSYTPTDAQLEQILSDLRGYMSMNTFSSASQFTQYLKDQGLQVDDALTSQITLKTKVFTIISTATVGDATAKITAVLDFSSSSEGSVKYWRVD